MTTIGRRLFSTTTASRVAINSIEYTVPKHNDIYVGICLDGSSQAYIDKAIEANCMPFLKHLLHQPSPLGLSRGTHGLVSSAMPSYTNPNNISIITGVPPKIHGICGNYFYDEANDTEVLMNDAKFLRAPSIFSVLSEHGTKVRVLTAKDKLRRLLSSNLSCPPAIAMSIEKSNLSMLPPPKSSIGIYDPYISIYLMEAAQSLIQHDLKHGNNEHGYVYYLSTTDYVQHKYEPGHAEANKFYKQVDDNLHAFDALGVHVGLTADHGMSAKHGYNENEPCVIYIEPILNELNIHGRVILPITDPYVAHHGALGGFATVYINDHNDMNEFMTHMRSLQGVATVMSRDEAVRTFDLPHDRIGDVVIIGDEHTTLGRSTQHHDLSKLEGLPLRSHGGITEMTVPMIFNRQLQRKYAQRLTSGNTRNYNLFDFLLNGLMLK